MKIFVKRGFQIPNNRYKIKHQAKKQQKKNIYIKYTHTYIYILMHTLTNDTIKNTDIYKQEEQSKNKRKYLSFKNRVKE